MDKEEFLEMLEHIPFDRTEFTIRSGGSLLLRGLREKTADFDLSVSNVLANWINMYRLPKDECGCYVVSDNVQATDNIDKVPYEMVEGYRCETLESILECKKRLNRKKDQADIAAIEAALENRHAA